MWSCFTIMNGKNPRTKSMPAFLLACPWQLLRSIDTHAWLRPSDDGFVHGAMVSLYFDDASLTDWQSSRGSAQCAFEVLNELLGAPFA